MHPLPAVITGQWKTATVCINGKIITLARFIRDVKADEQEPGDNRDILQECRGVRRFCWGDASQATYCLSLACCFYLNVSWVMDRFFTRELERAPQADIHLTYTAEELQAAYEACDEQFAQEFADFMKNLGAVPEEEA
jgi:hypothetical protein